ncbi:DUF5752 family protein [Methyloterricola oryzae]|uniref:DUF5752 family protein n=1 Tax=Methyloterricola oryzae TaxID=1495050 RepID=UPI0005EAFBBB|nr:DUF5752 family protein [Methyloterricola oryzae]
MLSDLHSKETVTAENGNFPLRDCALIAIATGVRAMTLNELRDGVQHVPPASIYHHFWAGLLEPRFEEREYSNDFAAWVHHGLHDEVLAERLALVNPTEFDAIEDLRQVLLDIIDERLDESERLPWLVAINPFEFIRTQTVVFDPRACIDTPKALARIMPTLSTGSIFYHFIDARRRSPTGSDDFSEWLGVYGDCYADLLQRLANIDPYFGSLIDLRLRLAATLTDCLLDGV